MKNKGKMRRLWALTLALVLALSVLVVPDGMRNTQAAVNGKPSISYAVHAQGAGWMTQVRDGATAGSAGKGKRVEAVAFSLNTKGLKAADGTALTGGLRSRAHVQSVGWMKPVTQKTNAAGVKSNETKGIYAGTTGKGLRLEAIELSLTGKVSREYDILYRVYVQGSGWMNWVKNGLTAGTIGKGKRIEAIEVKLLKKLTEKQSATLTGKSHVQRIGWKNDGTVTMGSANSLVLGTTGQGLRVEAFSLGVKAKGIKGGISVSSHVQSIGWQKAVGSGAISGTEGKALRVEAVKISLTGELAEYFDIWYRAHIQTYGWLSWAKNGAPCGSEGIARRMEALEIKILPKATVAPGKTTEPFIKGNVKNWQQLPGELVIRVNRLQNVVTVYKGGIPIRAMLCSTGDATPYGTYYTPNKFRWLGLVGPCYGQYCTQIVGDFLFHSVPYVSPDANTLMTEEYNKLGTTCSHGCIRLCVADAKWIYDNCALGTKVELYDSPDPGPLGKPALKLLPAGQTWDPTDPGLN